MKEKIEKYITDWERKCYYNGIPDEVPDEISDLVPSYKRICWAILRNDIHLQSLGFSRPKCEVYNEIKRQEIIQRNIKLNSYERT